MIIDSYKHLNFFLTELYVHEDWVQYLVQSVLGSGGEEILREGENLILKILLVKKFDTEAKNESFQEIKQQISYETLHWQSSSIYIYITIVFHIKNLKQSILRGFANKNLPKMFYKGIEYHSEEMIPDSKVK